MGSMPMRSSIIIAKEKLLCAGLRAKRTSVAIMLTVGAITPKAHDALLQIALVVTDAAMATFRVVHESRPQPSGGERQVAVFLTERPNSSNIIHLD